MKTCGALRLVFLGEIDHQHAQRFADLDRGQADAGRVVHGVQHVVGSLRTAASTRSTGLETWRRTGSGRMMSGLIVMVSHLSRSREKRQPGRRSAIVPVLICAVRAESSMLARMNDLSRHPCPARPALGATVDHARPGAGGRRGLLLLAARRRSVVALWRSATARAVAAAEAAEHARATPRARMAGILQAQAEMQGRMGTIADVFGARQAELNQSIGQRLDAHDRPARPDHDRADQVDA